jgi:DNA-binding NarL/FixJ family response regulator
MIAQSWQLSTVAEMNDEKHNSAEKNIRVLIVDDIYRVRQELATVLELAARLSQPGVQVVGEAQDGISAIELVDMLQPDVVLMDLEMPGMDGYLATRTIKSSNPSIKVIIFTIHGEGNERQKASEAGADAFLEKGTPIRDLLQIIQDMGRAS